MDDLDLPDVRRRRHRLYRLRHRMPHRFDMGHQSLSDMAGPRDDSFRGRSPGSVARQRWRPTRPTVRRTALSGGDASSADGIKSAIDSSHGRWIGIEDHRQTIGFAAHDRSGYTLAG